MGTLYNELQKWLKSPLEEKVRFKGIGPPTVKEHAKEVGKKEQRNVPNVVSSTSENAGKTSFALEQILAQQSGGRRHLPTYGPGYLSGQYAIDVATLANLPVQSLAYKTGHSPLLLPWALRYSPEQAYLDLGKLAPWDKWRVLWARIGAHYFQDTVEWGVRNE